MKFVFLLTLIFQKSFLYKYLPCSPQNLTPAFSLFNFILVDFKSLHFTLLKSLKYIHPLSYQFYGSKEVIC